VVSGRAISSLPRVEPERAPPCAEPERPSPCADADWWNRFEKLLSLRLPDLTGKTVLDVDACDGYFSFAAERFGASRVVAVDTGAWRRPGGRDSFARVSEDLASGVEPVQLEMLDISPETVGEFDVVLFLGLLGHTRHPLLALERIASVTRDLLVVETLVDVGPFPSPAVAFYPWKMLRDESSWWGPNRAAVEGMLRSVGFEHVSSYPLKRLSAARLVGLPARAKIATALMSLAPWGARRRLVRDLAQSALTQSRLVTHSWR